MMSKPHECDFSYQSGGRIFDVRRAEDVAELGFLIPGETIIKCPCGRRRVFHLAEDGTPIWKRAYSHETHAAPKPKLRLVRFYAGREVDGPRS